MYIFIIGGNTFNNKYSYSDKGEILEKLKDAENKIAELEESNKLYQSVTELVSDCVFKIDIGPDGNLSLNFLGLRPGKYSQDRFWKVLGYTPDELKTFEIFESIIHPDDLNSMQNFRQKVLLGYQTSYKCKIFTKNGEITWWEGTGKPVMDKKDQRVIGVIITANNVTKYKHVKADLKESEEKFREIFNKANDMITLVELEENGLPGRFLEVNDVAIRRLGYSRKELLEMKITEIIDPEYRPQIAKNAVKFKKNKPKTFEIAHVTKWGSKIPVEVSTYIFKLNRKNVILAISRDIRERKQSEEILLNILEELKLEKSQLNSVIKHIPVGIMILKGESLKILTSNESMEEIWGHLFSKGSKIRDYGLYGRFPTGGQPCKFEEWPIIRSLTSGENVINEEVEIFPKDGTKKVISVSSIPIEDDNGNIPMMVVINFDITERKHAEKKLKKLVNDLKNSNDELEQFIYSAYHDLQEPLRTVASYTQLIAHRYKDKLDLDANDFINYAVNGAIHMQQIIHDLLEYSGVVTNGGKFKPIDLENALNVAILNLNRVIENNNAKITYDPLPTMVADEGQIVQLFQNLIENAIKFKKENEPPRVHVSASKDKINNEYVFSVSDNGIGIEPRYAERIFIIFQKLYTLGKYPGTGIGLAVSKRIVGRHGGHIWVESEPMNGATFYFTISYDREHLGVEHAAQNFKNKDLIL
jgi:PAS domain S-box-containing protein